MINTGQWDVNPSRQVRLWNASLGEGVCPSLPSPPAVWIEDMTAGFPSWILRTGFTPGGGEQKEAWVPND